MMKNSFYFLFVGLLVLLGAEPFLAGLPRSGALVQLAYTAVLVIGVFSLAGAGRLFQVGVVLAVIGLLSGVGYLATDSTALRIVDLAAILCFSLLAIGVKAREVLFVAGPMTNQRIVGAMCIYLLLGVVWAVLFAGVQLADPAAFRYDGIQPGDPIEYLLYYSFVTLTTLGYGDITPVHSVARSLAYLEAVVGQLFIAVLIAGLVGRHVADRATGPSPTGA